MHVKIIEGEFANKCRHACYAYLKGKYRREKLGDRDLRKSKHRGASKDRVQLARPNQGVQKEAGTNEVFEYIDDGFSGEFLDRPALTKLRNDVKEGIISKVICLDPDRLSRKLMNQLIITDEFDRRDVELIFVNGEFAKTAEGQLFYSMRGAIAEFEKAKINERIFIISWNTLYCSGVSSIS